MNFAQQKDGWCGPASLSYGLMKQGIEKSQEEIAKKTDTTVKDGVDPNPLVRYVNSLPLQVRVFRGEDAEKTLEDMTHFLHFGYSVIVDYLEGKEGHYVVVEDINDTTIKIFDPEGGKYRSLAKNKFIANWKDYTEGGKMFKHWALCFKSLT